MSNWKITGPPRFFEGVGMVYPVTKGGSRFNAAEEDELKALLAGWISVYEDLPEPRVKVLTYSPGIFGVSCDELFESEELGPEGEKRFYFDDDPDGTVTHWMPCPAPPTN